MRADVTGEMLESVLDGSDCAAPSPAPPELPRPFAVSPSLLRPAVPLRRLPPSLPAPSSPTMTLADPSTSRPMPPQWRVRSPIRCADLPLMKTVALPTFAVHVFAPQQAAWIPGSPTRSAGRRLMLTSGEPWIAGPVPGWGHAGQPCASNWMAALSPSLPCPGTRTALQVDAAGSCAWRGVHPQRSRQGAQHIAVKNHNSIEITHADFPPRHALDRVLPFLPVRHD